MAAKKKAKKTTKKLARKAKKVAHHRPTKKALRASPRGGGQGEDE